MMNAAIRSRNPCAQGVVLLTVSLLVHWTCSAADIPAAEKYPSASHIPGTKRGWRQFLTLPDPAAPKDEPQGGKTAAGTPITPRTEQCFPAETRNLFWQMDRVASGPGGKLEPINYDVD